MSEMIPNNPLKNNGHLELELGAVCIIASSSFLCCLDVFVRAYKSVITWNLNINRNWFWVAFLFSLFGLFFPEYFPNEFKTEGTVHLYFEATVILTLVLLGQLLEAKAHSRTSGAIKELLKLAHRGYLSHWRKR
jgi:Cu2+-exporting ATPase